VPHLDATTTHPVTRGADAALVDERLDQLLDGRPDESARGLSGLQFDLGLAFVWFPQGAGGLGVRPELQRRVHEPIAAAPRAGTPGAEGSVGELGMAELGLPGDVRVDTGIPWSRVAR
jgi:hypothetical protein